MKLAIFGATGGVGGQVVRQALDAGHTVTAVVRDPARLQLRHPSLTVAIAADLAELEAAYPALEGSDAAISGVGPRARKDGPVASTATRGILRALDATGIHRFLAVSAAPVGPVPDDDGFLNRRILMPFIGVLLREVYADLTAMEDELRASTANWTAVRPPRLSNKPPTGHYRTAIGGSVPRGYSISRADVAHAMLAAIDDPTTFHQPLGVAY
jgi:putative NADH-flavin reductase